MSECAKNGCLDLLWSFKQAMGGSLSVRPDETGVKPSHTFDSFSLHQVATDQELAQALLAVKDGGLIPEDRVRLCVVGDGAPWILEPRA